MLAMEEKTSGTKKSTHAHIKMSFSSSFVYTFHFHDFLCSTFSIQQYLAFNILREMVPEKTKIRPLGLSFMKMIFNIHAFTREPRCAAESTCDFVVVAGGVFV